MSVEHPEVESGVRLRRPQPTAPEPAAGPDLPLPEGWAARVMSASAMCVRLHFAAPDGHDVEGQFYPRVGFPQRAVWSFDPPEELPPPVVDAAEAQILLDVLPARR